MHDPLDKTCFDVKDRTIRNESRQVSHYRKDGIMNFIHFSNITLSYLFFISLEFQKSKQCSRYLRYIRLSFAVYLDLSVFTAMADPRLIRWRSTLPIAGWERKRINSNRVQQPISCRRFLPSFISLETTDCRILCTRWQTGFYIEE